MDVVAVRELRKFLRVIEREVESQLKTQTVCCGVTTAQCHALLELAGAEEMSLVELSERLRLDTSTLSRTVDGLVKLGHVNRITDPDNRRYVRLGLTGKGKRKVDFIDRSCDQFYMHLLYRIPAEKRKALAESVQLLAEIFAKAKEEERCAAGASGCSVKTGRKHAGRGQST
jgi:DNA-binding MarR family transcriptional regulator